MTAGTGQSRAQLLNHYLEDPYLSELMEDIRRAGNIRSSMIDLTNKCNIRCQGCYYFVEGMDAAIKVDSEDKFYSFIEKEQSRGTNFITVLGGEPALELNRIKVLAGYFKVVVVTNGTIKIPYDGYENIRIGVSFWGDESRDIQLRGSGKRDIFSEALTNYKNDPRVCWYYTMLPGFQGGVAVATEKMIQNGNCVTYNFYADLANKGGGFSHQVGFDKCVNVINQMIRRYPDKIISSPHINETISSRQLHGEEWGYMNCPNVTYDHPKNAERRESGKFYGDHFRAYNADLSTTRRCCVGEARDCETCTDLWVFYGWIVGSLKQHIHTKESFTDWLCSTYMFYIKSGFLPAEKAAHLPKLHERMCRDVSRDFHRAELIASSI